jgi:hypothetical protein
VGDDGFAGLRIAQFVIRSPFHRQSSEASYDYRVALAQRLCHGHFDQAYGHIDILTREIAGSATHSLDDI